MDLSLKDMLNQKHITQRLHYYLEDDQLRLLFIVILLIGIILLLTGIKQAILFMLLGFGIIAFLCIFKPRKTLVEDFVCDSFYHVIDDSLAFEEDSENDYRMEESEPPITIIQKEKNRNINFKNSTRN
jgi:hypothetical protein